MTTFNHSLDIPATPEQVFAAICNPESLARWWGPAGFTNSFSVFEFKTGGRWNLVMHGPSGANYPNDNVFGEIVTNQKVVIEHPMQPVFRLTIELAHSKSGTLVSWAQAFESAEVAKQIEHIVVPANDENLQRLKVEVLGGSSQKVTF
ncbi:MAG: SRPBCC domain-containing protein [Burkholderiaceae bacterium]